MEAQESHLLLLVCLVPAPCSAASLRANVPVELSEKRGHKEQDESRWISKNGHSGDILCVAQCPPSLLATSSYDGEIIVWNVVSGRIQCRIVPPPAAQCQNAEGLDSSVPSIIFLKNLKVSSATLLLSSGAAGCINVWQVLSGGKFLSSFKASRFRQKITKLAKGDEDTLLYAADRIGYIYVFDMSKFSPELKTPRAENVWRAHTGRVSGLQIVDNDQVVLTSSTDFTVRLWSSRGHFIGTFGQSESWSTHIRSSWMHPAVPYEVLIHPLSVPAHGTSTVKTPRRSEEIDPVTAGADGGELQSARLPAKSISDIDIQED